MSTKNGNKPFEEYHKEFRNCILEINQQLLEETTPDLAIPLRQCEAILAKMKGQIRKAPDSSIQQEWIDTYNACDEQLASYQRWNRRTIEDEQEELFAGRTIHPSKEMSPQQNHHKDRLRSTRDHVESQTSQLQSALRSMRETEALAGEIQQELGRNRETIQRSKGHVGELSGMMKQANGHLKSLMRKWF